MQPVQARSLFGFAIVLALGLALQWARVFEPADSALLDAQFRLLRERAPQALGQDVVVVGIDEASLDAQREPFALWHPHLARFLNAMEIAAPAVLGLDVMLADRSYDFLVPGYDKKLTDALAAAKARSPLVLGEVPDEHGNARAIFAAYVAAAGADALASAALCRDPDSVVRRLGAQGCGSRDGLVTLSARMARHLGAGPDPRGLINYALGEPLGYIPFQTVLEWLDRNDNERLSAAFRGKPVLLGIVLPSAGREELPVALAAFEPANRTLPGVLVHAQALRSMLAQGLLNPVPGSMVFAITAAALLFWFGASGWKKDALLALVLLCFAAVSLNLLWKGWFLPSAGIMIAALAATLVRHAYDSALQKHARNLLQAAFQSNVSPRILRDIVSGRIRPPLAGTRERICVLACGIRQFAARVETLAPEEVIELLDAYFTEMTLAVQKHEGTIDKFAGDGMIAFFGAPKPLACPEKNALEAAQDMLEALARVNRGMQQPGRAPLAIGLGLHSDDVVLGYVGGESHREYLAIGAAPDIAARLEKMTREAGFPVVCSAAVADALGRSGGLQDLGERVVAGRGAMHVFGWNPPVLAADSSPAAPQARA